MPPLPRTVGCLSTVPFRVVWPLRRRQHGCLDRDCPSVGRAPGAPRGRGRAVAVPGRRFEGRRGDGGGKVRPLRCRLPRCLGVAVVSCVPLKSTPCPPPPHTVSSMASVLAHDWRQLDCVQLQLGALCVFSACVLELICMRRVCAPPRPHLVCGVVPQAQGPDPLPATGERGVGRPAAATAASASSARGANVYQSTCARTTPLALPRAHPP